MKERRESLCNARITDDDCWSSSCSVSCHGSQDPFGVESQEFFGVKRMKIKEPTAQEKREVYLALVKARGGVDRFINKGKKPCKKALGEQTGVSFAFSLNDFADGKYQYFAPKSK